ncbi:unnamed protein product [Oikopleura dioica]|uniref:Carbohydrate kinase PfkB domain-containing protein n=1 Tax=Oikopleura dioica TaxID=34765 RepID=E4XL03_OIKDI|nr:unnamed protein product [Oikopleura dioica]CBY31491.1 unnamed protein product [Oikopleura dioica]CBY38551.1 unnamed protein product [Oikopleura dioica]
MSVKILVVGSLNVDQIAYCPRLPLPGETILGEKTIYSPAPCPKREDFETFCEKIDFLIANETEALQLSGSENISEAFEALQKKYKIKNVIVTLGSDGFALKTDEELTNHPVAEKVEVVLLRRKTINLKITC